MNIAHNMIAAEAIGDKHTSKCNRTKLHRLNALIWALDGYIPVGEETTPETLASFTFEVDDLTVNSQITITVNGEIIFNDVSLWADVLLADGYVIVVPNGITTGNVTIYAPIGSGVEANDYTILIESPSTLVGPVSGEFSGGVDPIVQTQQDNCLTNDEANNLILNIEKICTCDCSGNLTDDTVSRYLQ